MTGKLKRPGENPVKQRRIIVGKTDMNFWDKLIHVGLHHHDGLTGEYHRILRSELQRARVMPDRKIPPHTVTLNSVVTLTDLDSGDVMCLTLVMPEKADAGDYVSILSPLGMAIFGYQSGDTITWGPIRSPMRLQIDRVDRSQVTV